MQGTREELLIVDDEPAIRKSMTLVMQEFGYVVRTAENGFSALFEMNRLSPDILLSDLNMPGMSGFELLQVVQRSFPATRVIAMSGAFSGSEVPAGVVADAFYQKGSSILALLKIIEALPQRELRPPQLPGVLTQRDLNVSSDRTPTQSLLRERTSTFTALAAPLLDS